MSDERRALVVQMMRIDTRTPAGQAEYQNLYWQWIALRAADLTLNVEKHN